MKCEGKKALARTAFREAFLKTLFCSIGEAILLIGKDDRVVMMNSVAEKLTGWKENSAKGKKVERIFRVMNEKTHKPLKRSIGKVLREKCDGGLASHVSLISKDRRKYFIGCSLVPVEREEGSGADILLVFRDITDRKEAERKLTDLREKRFNLVIENFPQRVFLKDRHSVYISCNALLAKDLKISSKNVMGKTDYDFFPREIADKYRRDDLRILKTGKMEEFEEDYVVNGRRAKVQTTKTCFRDDKGNVVGLLGIFSDITARKLAEEELRESEKRFRTIFENAGDGILLVDQKTKRFFMGNEAICRMLGYRKDEISRLRIKDIHPPKDVPYVIKQFERQARGEIALVQEIPVMRKNGDVFFADVNASVVKIGGKEYLAGFFHDVTEHKQIEEEKIRSSELKISAEIRAKFASTVSHELRSPMGAIIEGIGLVLDGSLGAINDRQKELLSLARNNTERLGRLINNVLDYQRMESGNMEYDIREADINDVVREVQDTMDILAKEKNLVLTSEVEASLPVMKFDRDRIAQVLTNVLSNAIKYTDRGTISLIVREEGPFVHVSVKDTGPGIKKEDLKRLFLPFVQLDGWQNKKKGGSGLGLSISKDIVVAHGGKIWAESKPGEGSSIHFTLPLK